MNSIVACGNCHTPKASRGMPIADMELAGGHFKGERWFGNTQQGKYMCEHAADAEGDRPTTASR